EVVLRGNLRSTPRLSALRVWFPRFSYLAQYLPTVYREEDREARFLERFLANFEGLFTAIEDRIAAAQVLFDVRTAPQDTLDWLAAWLGIVLDPSWDEARRRRFIRHAMLLFRFRGTVHGIRLALQLATAECVEAADLMPATPERERAFGIRIVERYRARRLPGVLLGEPLAASGPRAGSLQARWTPAEGRARLAQRYQDYLQARGIAAAGLDFPLSPPDEDGLRGAWESFAREQLGFVPAGSEGERLQWQRFLSLRYPDVSRLKARYEWSDFAAVRLPRDWPEIADQRQDWRDFIAETSSATSERGRWQAFLARRYRALRELNAAYRTRWPGFELLALPEGLPPDGAALADWHAYEATVRPMRQAAHRFVVYLPTRDLGSDPVRVADRLSLAHRIIELEKPAHTVFDVRQYLALFRIGEARLGHDTLLGSGSRAPELMPAFVLGRNHLGIGHLAPRDPLPGDRRELAC
ncbi:MAG: hypothetical protein FJ189_05210, partial [Gammaproteobacteria bacterium]|nr:hypothetical protein [Gammaproteobacteria bacterium]